MLIKLTPESIKLNLIPRKTRPATVKSLIIEKQFINFFDKKGILEVLL